MSRRQPLRKGTIPLADTPTAPEPAAAPQVDTAEMPGNLRSGADDLDYIASTFVGSWASEIHRAADDARAAADELDTLRAELTAARAGLDHAEKALATAIPDWILEELRTPREPRARGQVQVRRPRRWPARPHRRVAGLVAPVPGPEHAMTFDPPQAMNARHHHTLGRHTREPDLYAITRRCTTCNELIMMFPLEQLDQLHPRHPWRIAAQKLAARDRFRAMLSIRLAMYATAATRLPRNLVLIASC